MAAECGGEAEDDVQRGGEAGGGRGLMGAMVQAPPGVYEVRKKKKKYIKFYVFIFCCCFSLLCEV